VVVFFAFLLTIPVLTMASPLAYPAERISGQDRIETALNIAQKGWVSAQTVILCEYADYPDSIAAAPFAASLDAPILLTGGNKLDQRVILELQRLKPQKVILLGGEGRLKSLIETELTGLSLSWERIGAENRYATSVLLAGKISSDSLIIANGDNFPDALSAASYAGIQQIPIVLTSKSLPSSVVEYCERTRPQHIIVIGGEGAIPTEALRKYNLNIETRLGGQNRYETNAKVVNYMKDSVQENDFFLASGMNFPDAIAGTVLASKLKAPLLLTEKEDIPPAVYRIMREHMKVEPSTVITTSGQGKITASGGLILRDTPSSSGRAQLTIPEGATVEITASQGQWYKTTYQSRTGWISANYVNILMIYKQGKITASGKLNLRQSPSTTAEILTTIPQGVLIPITDEQTEWYKTNYQGTAGWVHADYVSILSSESDGLNPETGSETTDLSVNGTVNILGGSGVISENTQNIIRGRVASGYADNLKDFPSLPSSLTGPASPLTYDPNQEVLLDPFEGIQANALEGKKILIDPGHGGPDPGASGACKSYEKYNNLAIAQYLNNILIEAGATVSMTRATDVCLAENYSESADLQARVALANDLKPDIYISIHNNWNSNPETKGTTTYYSVLNQQKSESARLAQAIQQTITSTVHTVDDGVREANFYVIKNTSMPAALIEVGFLSNSWEEARLQNPIFQKNVASAVFRGIYDYFI